MLQHETMVIGAAQLLEANDAALDPITRGILVFCAALDNAGAWTWNLRTVGLLSATILGGVRIALGRKRNVPWDSLIHAIVSSAGSLACVYLDYCAPQLTEFPEPLRSMQCQGPLTSLHRILPGITMGYALFDMIDGLTLTFDFFVHGIATLALMAYYCENDVPQFVSPTLVMEVSTIFLLLVRADFLSATMLTANMGAFALSFFIFRIVVGPYVWFRIVSAMWQQYHTDVYKACFPHHLIGVTFVFGMTFNCLNAFWFYKIVKKIRRKFRGEEKLDANNDMTNGDHLDSNNKKTE